MYCSSCNQSIPDQSTTCPNCGAPVGMGAPPPAPQAAPTPPAAQGQWPPVQQQPGAPVPPPAPGPFSAAPAAQPGAYAAPLQPSLKTSTDTVSGILFLVFGVGLLAYCILYFVGNLETIIYLIESLTYWGGFFGADDPFLLYNTLPYFIECLGAVLWLVGGILLILAGIFCLTSGRGRKPAIVALPFMLVALLCEVAAIAVLLIAANEIVGYLPNIFELILPSLAVWILWLVSIIVVIVMLPLKRNAKRKAAGAGLAPPAGQVPPAGAYSPPPAVSYAPPSAAAAPPAPAPMPAQQPAPMAPPPVAPPAAPQQPPVPPQTPPQP